MYARAYKAIASILLAVSSAGSIFAQSHVGTAFSLDRSGVTFGSAVSGDAFWDIFIGADYGGSVLGQEGRPGAAATFSYNFILRSWRHSGGSSFLYAGPGVALGYVHDKGQPYGLMGGISGILGYEYEFAVPVSVGIGIRPTFGVHMGSSGGGMLMDIYRNGLVWALSPQVSLRYRLPSGRPASGAGSGQGRESSAEGTGGLGPETVSGDGDRSEDSGKRRDWPLLTYGLEWGYSANVNHAFHHNYTSAGGRVDERGDFMCFRSLGIILAHVGINCGRHLNLSVRGGYEGIYPGQAVWPVSIRGTWLFGRDPSERRWLAFLDGGWAVSSSDYDAGAIARAGAGYRISLSRSVKLDLMLSFEYTSASIDLYDDEGEPVEPLRIRRNDNYFSSINFSIGITL